ncbi:MAG: hypothetical protein ACK48W_12345, partial [Bacteroidota bacterium]
IFSENPKVDIELISAIIITKESILGKSGRKKKIPITGLLLNSWNSKNIKSLNFVIKLPQI